MYSYFRQVGIFYTFELKHPEFSCLLHSGIDQHIFGVIYLFIRTLLDHPSDQIVMCAFEMCAFLSVHFSCVYCILFYCILEYVRSQPTAFRFHTGNCIWHAHSLGSANKAIFRGGGSGPEKIPHKSTISR